MDQGKRLVINTVSNFATLAVSAVVGFLLAPYILSRIGQESYGIWALTGSLLGYSQLLSLGLNSAVIDDEIVVVNTGLEVLQFLDADGQIVREMNVASKPTWERFDRNTDYRKIVGTKPHEVHVNHAFKMDGQWWATRCLKCDAINLSNPEDRIEITVGQPHDGIKRGDFVYFTTTNGHIVIANADSRKTEEVINIRSLDSNEGKMGWCRGLEIDGSYAYVGFSRLRASKWKEAFRVIKDFTHGSLQDSHICKIDLKRKEIVDTYDYDRMESVAIFSLANYDLLARQAPDA